MLSLVHRHCQWREESHAPSPSSVFSIALEDYKTETFIFRAKNDRPVIKRCVPEGGYEGAEKTVRRSLQKVLSPSRQKVEQGYLVIASSS